jgi:hypothetical protein
LQKKEELIEVLAKNGPAMKVAYSNNPVLKGFRFDYEFMVRGRDATSSCQL